MWLEMILVQEVAEEVTYREAEAALEVGDKNHTLPLIRHRR